MNTEQEEIAAWFLLSVLRHLRNEEWQDESDSGLDKSQLLDLVDDFLDDRSVKHSLQLVLRNQDLQKRLIVFGAQRDVAKLQLTESSLAYARAAELLTAFVCAEASKKNSEPHAEDSQPNLAMRDVSNAEADQEFRAVALREPGQSDSEMLQTSVQRRAARRGRSDPILVGEFEPSGQEKNTENLTERATMSDAEFERLQRVLNSSQEMPASDQHIEHRSKKLLILSPDRRSWLIGALAGLAVFLLANLLFF